MRFKRIAAGTLAASAFLIGTAGVAHADQPAKVIGYGKGTFDANGNLLCAVIGTSGTGHWSSDFNPSDINAQLKGLVAANPTCDGKTGIVVAGQLLKP